MVKLEDMERLIDLRSAMLRNLLWQVHYNVDEVNQEIRYVGRTRYRLEPGVCDEVKAKK